MLNTLKICRAVLADFNCNACPGLRCLPQDVLHGVKVDMQSMLAELDDEESLSGHAPSVAQGYQVDCRVRTISQLMKQVW